MKNNGFDGNFKLDHKIGEVSMQVRGNFTYSRNEITEADELVNRYPYLRRTGFQVDQAKGLIALGLFRIMRSAAAPWDFGNAMDVMPGDIKYKDISSDGIVNNDDVVPIGATTSQPDPVSAFRPTGWLTSMFTCRVPASPILINGFTVYPFINSEWGNILAVM